MELTPHITGVVVVTIVGTFTFLVRSFFSRIHDDLRELKGSLDKMQGRFEAVSVDVRANTVEMAVVRSELRAVWRIVDRSNQHTADS